MCALLAALILLTVLAAALVMYALAALTLLALQRVPFVWYVVLLPWMAAVSAIWFVVWFTVVTILPIMALLCLLVVLSVRDLHFGVPDLPFGAVKTMLAVKSVAGRGAPFCVNLPTNIWRSPTQRALSFAVSTSARAQLRAKARKIAIAFLSSTGAIVFYMLRSWLAATFIFWNLGASIVGWGPAHLYKLMTRWHRRALPSLAKTAESDLFDVKRGSASVVTCETESTLRF